MTAIYHITHLSNLARIVQTKGLWCDAERVKQGFPCVGIAHQSLKDRRSGTAVLVAAGGNLADYVPFYFANRSPMLYSIHKGFVHGYEGGQKSIVYLVSSVERVVQGKRPWCFTDGHAVEAMTSFCCDPAELSRVDWAVIEHWSWKDTDEDPDRKRRKQAEFLVHRSFPWSWVEEIGVIDEEVGRQVKTILAGAQHQPAVTIEPKWYY
jgi:hypothetical protein